MGTPNDKQARRRRLTPAQRRAQLIECALAVFAERGVRRAVHADVAKAARCAVSTVFLYFPNRDALVDGALDEVARLYLDLAEEVHASTAPAEEVLLEHGRRFRDSIDTHREQATILLDWSTSVRSRIWSRYLELIERMVGYYRSTIERGIREGDVHESVDSESAARIIVGYAQMTAQLKLSAFEPERASQISRRIVSAMLAPAGDEFAA